MIVVIDTNVILSALISSGLSARVFDICLDLHDIYISEHIVKEVLDKLETKFKVSQRDINSTKAFIKKAFIKATPEGELPDACRDPDDNNILHLARTIDADLIITGDKDLIVLKKFGNTAIINPRTFIEKYRNC